jgi:hypothetical protein
MKNRNNDRSDASLQVVTLAMFMDPGLEPVLPSGRLSQKMYTYHLDRAPWEVTKHTARCVLLKKTKEVSNLLVFFQLTG